MCNKCADALDKYFPPGITSEYKRQYILWGMTAFPCASGETIAKQIQEAYWGLLRGLEFIELRGFVYPNGKKPKSFPF